MSDIQRSLELPESTFFLWGPRQSGKTTLLKTRFPDAYRIDLLRTDERIRFEREPARLREEIRALPRDKRVVIDEVQKVPALLDEVHYLIQEENWTFALCGSSARKIRRSHANLLGGRALKRELLGLSARELGKGFALDRMLNHGPLPPHYLSDSAAEHIAAYVDLYLKEEILDEGLTRNLPVFATFLRAAAIGDTEVTNFSNIARECGVASSTVRGYYEILEDTLIGALLPAFTRRARRRVLHAPKFYFRDVGVVNHLVRRHAVEEGAEAFGKAFENWVFHELSVHQRHARAPYELAYWRLSSGIEVDFVLGDAETAIEVKGKSRLQSRDTRHLEEFRKEYPSVKNLVIVCLEPQARITSNGIRILPYLDFLDALWQGEFIG
ncbi:MAG: AAA family ATPase [Verrucomicrobia bacterium]|nr:AAA family ATPase [Verrucomicrobiota bacterium]